MAQYRTLDDLTLKGKTALVRLDLNVPMADGSVTDTTRIDRSLSTIADLSSSGAKVVMLSHFGRPKGQRVDDLSLRQVVPALANAVGKEITFCDDCIGPDAEKAVDALSPGGILLLENTRFHAGEEKNDPTFAQKLAALGDIYINDAFSVSHRAHATSEGLARLLPAAAGRAMEAELKALAAVLEAPEKPVVAIVGGAKVSTKLTLLSNLLDKVDYVVIGGGMANTFLAAQGKAVGKSLCEHDLADTAREILEKAKKANTDIVLPTDVVIASEFKEMAAATTVSADDVPDDQMILDVGPDSLANIGARLEAAKTVLWNGPLGAFEVTPFDNGTNTAAQHVAMLTKMGQVTSVAGGGDTLAALANAGATKDFSYVSTAGGAFLEWLEGKELPGVKALET